MTCEYTLGSVMLGDSRECLHGILSHADFPVVVTDPPFNIGYHYDAYADRMDEGGYYAMLADVVNACRTVMVHYPEALYKVAMASQKTPDRVVAWCYNSNTPRQHRDIAYFGVTPCFDGLGEYKNPTDKRIAKRIAEGKRAKGYDWLYCDQVKNVSEDKTSHPCQMPLEVMLYVVASLPAEATIIDPFAGSGTTLLAAKRLGRKFVGVEMSEKYYAEAVRRLAEDTPLFDFYGEGNDGNI